MSKDKRETVYYVCYYAEPDFSGDIVSYPSVWSKINYVSDCIKKNGFDICYVCPVMPLHGRFRKREVQIDEHEKHVYFSAYRNPNWRISQILNGIAQILQILTFLLKNQKKMDRILIYHSMFHVQWTWILHYVFRRQFLLEIEDVYSALSPKGKCFEKKEWRFFESASGYLCVNSLICDKINNPAPKIISHGRYAIPEIIEEKETAKCRLVYAGVIEQVRNGAFLAVEAMLCLPADYELIILGFGKESDIADLRTLIEKVNYEKGWECIHYLGYMSGETYLRELQKCSIALSTHMYDDSNMKSADYTFPSKLLVYMANGLNIVAQNLECLRTSDISDYIYYYESPTPKAVAEAVLDVDTNRQCDSRRWIEKLDREFVEGLKRILLDM